MYYIKEVKSHHQLVKFVDFPNKLYKDVKQYTPPMYSDEMNLFNKKKNGAYEYCETKFFLAYKGNRIVGRCGAILNKAYNLKMNVKQVRFTRFDAIDDIEVFKLLIAEVAKWAKSLGMTEIVGPNGYCDFDREGMLIEGYQYDNMLLTYYNLEYYPRYFEEMGFKKEVDWVEYRVKVPSKDDENVIRLAKLSKRIEDRFGYKVDVIRNFKGIAPTVYEAIEVLNHAFKSLYGTVKLNDRQKKFYADQFIPVATKDFAIFVRNKEGQMIGMGFLVPELSKTLKKSKGKLFPFGFVRVLKQLRNFEVMDMYIVGVLPEYQNTGVNAVILNYAINSCIKNNVKYCETGPELETNTQVQAMWKNFETLKHKRRRLFKISVDEFLGNNA